MQTYIRSALNGRYGTFGGTYNAQNPNENGWRRRARADHLRDEVRRDTNHRYHRCSLKNSGDLERCAENTMIRTHFGCVSVWKISKVELRG